jgi:formylglycine-generating enzyme required for sulfatase activity
MLFAGLFHCVISRYYPCVFRLNFTSKLYGKAMIFFTESMSKITTVRSLAMWGAMIVGGLSSCGVGTGTADNTDLTSDIGLTGTPAYVTLNLDTGAVEARIDIPDLVTNRKWRTSYMVFHRVSAQTNVTLGLSDQQEKSVDGYLDDDDKDERPRVRPAFSHPNLYVGVFEVTRSQWLKLGGVNTWTDYGKGLVVDNATEDMPASGMARNDVIEILKKAKVSGLRLPTRNEWEVACRGPGLSLWAWGDDAEQFGPFAVLSPLEGEDSENTPKLSPVAGSRQPNVNGLFDLHGNVAELVAPESGESATSATIARVCGGSWSDTVLTARATNVVSLLSDQGHPLVGIRLVVKP